MNTSKVTEFADPEEQDSEERFTAAAYKWACNTHKLFGLLVHIPNELTRMKGESKESFIGRIMKLKAMGVTKGAPDFILPWNNKFYAIELKVEGKGRVSDAQKILHEKWRAQGAKVYLAWNIPEFEKIINWIITQ